MTSDSHNPSADEIFSVLETEFTRVTGNTPPPSPGQTRCLYSFRVDVVVERIGRRYRLVSIRPVRNPGGPYSPNVRRDHRTGPPPTSSCFTGYGSPSRHPYDPPLRQHQSRPSSSVFSQQTGCPLNPTPGRVFANPTSSPSFSPSPSSSGATGNTQRPTFDRESHQRFMKKLELLIQAEERLKAQKAREHHTSSDSARGSGGEKIPSTPR